MKKINHPATKRVNISDNFHGTKVDDPFRWLEDVENDEVQSWTRAQNEVTKEYLSQIPEYGAIKKRLTELWQYPHYTSVIEKNGKFFFRKNTGFQNQPSLYMRDQSGSTELLLDLENLSDDSTVALMGEFYSKDGSLLAYSLAASGSDWQKIRIMHTETKEKYPEILEYSKFPQIAWHPDKTGFFYNRQPDTDSVSPEERNNYRHIRWHSLGTPQTEDPVIFQHEEKSYSASPSITDDGEYLMLWVYHGTDQRNGLYYRRLNEDGEFKRLFEIKQAEFSPAGNLGEIFIVHTNLDAPNGRIVAVDLNQPEPEHWKTIVPENDDAIDQVRVVDSKLVVKYFHHAHHLIHLFDIDGVLLGEIPLPALGTVNFLSGGQTDARLYFSFSSFLYPDTIFVYDFYEGALKPFAADQGIEFPVEEYETVQKFYTSKDGTRVPIFLTHKKGIKLDSRNPTILYGYGGFNLAQTPFFKVWNLTWCEMGGVFALANLRGGNEYGEEWHQAGMLEKKQTVFDDMHAAAEWLIEEKYTSTEKLAIEGRSNGGLLTAACMLQRPDLYKAVLCHVPVIDMLRYHNFTVGHFWVPEYGNAELSKEHFDFLYAYSPLHNVQPGKLYPPVLVTTADTDDRVVPSHSKKFIATLQSMADPTHPYLLRVEVRAGHGLGKPISKLIEERTDCWAFLVDMLEMDIG